MGPGVQQTRTGATISPYINHTVWMDYLIDLTGGLLVWSPAPNDVWDLVLIGDVGIK